MAKQSKLSKLGALQIVARECHNEHNSANSLARLRTAMQCLGLTLVEMQEFEILMEYRRINGDLLPVWAHMEYPELQARRDEQVG